MCRMEQKIEKLIVALMVLIDKNGGEYKLDASVYKEMYGKRHKKGIHVQEIGDEAIVLKLGDMTISPDDAMMN